MSSYNLQVGLVDALRADAPLMAIVDQVWDNPPQRSDPESNAPFPFITVDISSAPWDTDTELGFEATAIIHSWSRARNGNETRQIQDAVYNVLHRGTIGITGELVITVHELSRSDERDPDGITRHGIQEYRITYQET